MIYNKLSDAKKDGVSKNLILTVKAHFPGHVKMEPVGMKKGGRRIQVEVQDALLNNAKHLGTLMFKKEMKRLHKYSGPNWPIELTGLPL